MRGIWMLSCKELSDEFAHYGNMRLLKKGRGGLLKVSKTGGSLKNYLGHRLYTTTGNSNKLEIKVVLCLSAVNSERQWI